MNTPKIRQDWEQGGLLLDTIDLLTRWQKSLNTLMKLFERSTNSLRISNLQFAYQSLHANHAWVF